MEQGKTGREGEREGGTGREREGERQGERGKDREREGGTGREREGQGERGWAEKKSKFDIIIEKLLCIEQST